jgi:hypothetical protein
MRILTNDKLSLANDNLIPNKKYNNYKLYNDTIVENDEIVEINNLIYEYEDKIYDAKVDLNFYTAILNKPQIE